MSLRLTAAAYFLIRLMASQGSCCPPSPRRHCWAISVYRGGPFGPSGHNQKSLNQHQASRNGTDQSVKFGIGGAITMQLLRLPGLLQLGQRRRASLAFMVTNSKRPQGRAITRRQTSAIVAAGPGVGLPGRCCASSNVQLGAIPNKKRGNILG
jgi:hypothetical protein